jgi:hypothetical protein
MEGTFLARLPRDLVDLVQLYYYQCPTRPTRRWRGAIRRVNRIVRTLTTDRTNILREIAFRDPEDRWRPSWVARGTIFLHPGELVEEEGDRMRIRFHNKRLRVDMSLEAHACSKHQHDTTYEYYDWQRKVVSKHRRKSDHVLWFCAIGLAVAFFVVIYLERILPGAQKSPRFMFTPSMVLRFIYGLFDCSPECSVP